MSGIFQGYANSDGRVRASAVTKVPEGSANDRGMIVAGCRMQSTYPWDPDEALLFMPDECSDPPDCNIMVPATQLRDVSLLAGQPPRQFN